MAKEKAVKKKKSDEWKSKVCGDCERQADDTCPKDELRYWAKACQKFKKLKEPKQSSGCPCCGQSPCTADSHGHCRPY